ncbi:MAG: hypothetical protein AAF799_44000, partial [Myxococcota bacterium]
LSSLHQMLRQIRLVPELSRAIPYDMMDKLYSMAGSTFWPYMATDTAAWGVLAAIVLMVKSTVSNPARN